MDIHRLLEGIIGTNDVREIGAAQVRHYLGDYSGESPAAPHSASQDQVYDERSEIAQALRVFRNNKSKAAAYLRISRNTLYKRMREYNLQ